MSDEQAQIRKSDVPYILRPPAVLVVTAVVAILYAVYLLPKARPDLIEALVGIIFGLASGFLLSLVYLAYAREVSRECREIPELRLAYSLRPPQKPEFLACIGAFFLLWMSGMAGMNAAIKAFSHAPGAGLRNSISSLVVFLLLTLLIPAWRAAWWHSSLPD